MRIISILCYTVKDNHINTIELVNSDGYLLTVENFIDNSKSIINRGKELLENKYDIKTETSDWNFLGELKRGNSSPVIYSYAVDVTNYKTSKLETIKINSIKNLNDSVVLSSFLKLFLFFYKQNFINHEGITE